MIPNNSNVAVVDNHLDGRKIGMRIDAAATVHLMAILAGLYGDQELACIREYATNADDAHKDAGQTRPIEVSTPTSLSPYLKIRDWGVGMDAQTIEDVYSQYGRSTKRTQTNTNGSMGIGGKSALSYTNQFSVVGIKDSIKTHVSVSIGADGCGVMEIVDESLTDEPNGVEIVIPAKRYNDFPSKAQTFFKYWAKGTVLLNGKDPAGEMVKISDHLFTMGENSYEYDVVVMGNVAYPVNDGLSGGTGLHKYGKKPHLVAYVTMNTPDEVVFTPSREGLIYTAQTNKVVSELRAEYRASVVKSIEDTFANAATFGEAYTAFLKFERTYDSSLLANVKYQGHDMPTGYIKKLIDPADATKGSTGHTATIWSTRESRYAVQSGRNIGYEQIVGSLIITNYPRTNGVPSTHKAKVKSYRKDNNITSWNVIFLPDGMIPGLPWTAEATVVDWSVIRTIQLTTTNSNYAAKSYAGGYDVYDPAVGYYTLTHDLKKSDTVIYYSKTEYKDRSGDSQYLATYDRDLILQYISGARIVECGAGRHEKLRRLFPNAMTPTQAKNKAAKTVIDTLTPLEKEQIKIKSVRHLDYLSGIDYTGIDDPELRRAVEVYRMKDTPGTTAFARIPASSRDKALEDIGKPAFDDVQSRYPLLTYHSHHRADHLIYINAKYATFPKGN